MGDFYKVVGRLNASPTVPATILLLTAGATKRIRVHELLIGSRNGAALSGARLSVGRPTTAGTGGAAYTPQINTDGAPAAIFTALSGTTVWSAEPTQPASYLDEIPLDVVATLQYRPVEPWIVPVTGRLAVRVEEDNSTTKVQWVVTALVEE